MTNEHNFEISAAGGYYKPVGKSNMYSHQRQYYHSSSHVIASPLMSFFTWRNSLFQRLVQGWYKVSVRCFVTGSKKFSKVSRIGHKVWELIWRVSAGWSCEHLSYTKNNGSGKWTCVGFRKSINRNLEERTPENSVLII